MVDIPHLNIYILWNWQKYHLFLYIELLCLWDEFESVQAQQVSTRYEMNEKREYSLKKENTHFSKRITQNKENHSIPMKDKPNGMRMVRKSQAIRTRITITSTQ